jgi:DNA-binding transcriptional ArsR family regulator
MESQQAVQALSALAQPHRLAVFRRLVVAGHSGMTPGVLAEHLGLPAATLSFHLKELLNASLVSQERDGRNLIYRARFDQTQALVGFLTENCCSGAACVDVAPVCSSCEALA